MGSRGFWRELKRRHVYRVAAAYAVVGWLLIQAVTQIFPVFHMPDWIEQAVVLVILVGFPIALVLAWAFDTTSAGIVKTDAVTEAAAGSMPPRHPRRAGAMVGLIGVVLAAIAGVAWWQLRAPRVRPPPASSAHVAALRGPAGSSHPPGNAAPGSARTPSAGSATATVASGLPAQPVPAKSVAVLPFENLSTDKGNAYFADGIQDLILTKLADIGDLKVISRTSTAKYASHPDDLKTIGQQLGVAAILEGSVQKAGNQVLINVQLIDAKTDAHIWAQSYQRTLTNIFGVEGEVAGKVAAALNTKLSVAESHEVTSVPTTNPVAYNAFLQAEYYSQRGVANASKADFLTAFNDYRKAVRADPAFALAWANLARAQLMSFRFIGNAQPGFVANMKANIDHAFALQPHLEQAYLAKGLYLYYIKEDGVGAAAAFAMAHEQKPQDVVAIFWSGVMLQFVGKWSAAQAVFQRALALDPRSTMVLAQMGVGYNAVRRYADAARAFRHALAIDPSASGTVMDLAGTYSSMGDLDAMHAVLEAASAGVKAEPSFWWASARYFMFRRQWTSARTALLHQATAPQLDWGTECMLGDVERLSGKPGKARSYYQHCVKLLPAAIHQDTAGRVELGTQGLALVHLARLDEALALGRRGLTENPPKPHNRLANARYYEALLLMAQIQAQAGMRQAAVATVEQLLSIPDAGLFISVPLLKIDPVWDPIRHDPRFQALLQRYAAAEAVAQSAARESAAASSAAGHD